MPTKKSLKPAPSTSSLSRVGASGAKTGSTTKKIKTSSPGIKKSSNIRAYVGYITIIGWFIAYFALKSENKDYELFHLKQSLGLHLSMLAFEILSSLLFFLLPVLWIIYIVVLAIFILKAKDGKKETVPYVGDRFQTWFSFL